MDRLAVKRKLLTDLKGYASKGAAQDMAKRHGLTAKPPTPEETEPPGVEHSPAEEAGEGMGEHMGELSPEALAELLSGMESGEGGEACPPGEEMKRRA